MSYRIFTQDGVPTLLHCDDDVIFRMVHGVRTPIKDGKFIAGPLKGKEYTASGTSKNTNLNKSQVTSSNSKSSLGEYCSMAGWKKHVAENGRGRAANKLFDQKGLKMMEELPVGTKIEVKWGNRGRSETFIKQKDGSYLFSESRNDKTETMSAEEAFDEMCILGMKYDGGFSITSGEKTKKEPPKVSHKERVKKATSICNGIVEKLSNGSFMIQYGEVDDDETVVSGEVRSWGDWIMPERDWDEDDDYREEDYDWKVLSPASSKRLKTIVNKYQDENPDYDIKVTTGEKEYIYIDVKIDEQK